MTSLFIESQLTSNGRNVVKCVRARVSLSSAPPVFPLRALTCFDSSSPGSSGHPQSHPTLPITSSILVTVGALKRISPLSLPNLANPHFSSVFRGFAFRSSSFFLSFLHISLEGELKRTVGVQICH